MTEQEIKDICKKYNIENYTINPDGSIDVDGIVKLKNKDLVEIPLKFNKVSRSFDCSHNQLTTLEGSPKEVGGAFDCSCNNLTTLEGSPKVVGRNLLCYHNPLESLEGYNGNYKKLICQNRKKLVEIDIIDRKKKVRKQKLKLTENL